MRKIERVREFLRQHRRSPALDNDMIKSIHSDPSAEMAPLFVSDLDYLVKYANRRHVVVALPGNGNRIHVYGPFTQDRAAHVQAALLEQAVQEQYILRCEVRPLLDTDRKEVEARERAQEKEELEQALKKAKEAKPNGG